MYNNTKESLISFDIAVTVNEKTQGEKGGGIKVYAISAGGKKEKTNEQETVSHIKFKIQAQRGIE